MDRGGEWDRGAGHPGDPRAPNAAADCHDIGPDDASAGPHPADVASLYVDADDFGAWEHGQGALFLGALAHQGAREEGIHNTHAGAVEAPQKYRFINEWDLGLDLSRRKQLGFFAPRLGRRHPPLELFQALRRAGHFDPPALRKHAEGTILAHALLRKEGHLLRVIHREDEV